MGIFGRRTIQAMLEENADFLTAEQLEEHVRRLNANNLQSLDTEWEVAVLNAFSKLGQIEHEPGDSGSRPDLVFSSDLLPGITLVADIATVSDDGNEDESSVEYFYNELESRLRVIGRGRGCVSVEILDQFRSAGQKYRTRLSLPPRSEFATEIFNSEFKRFLNAIKTEPDKPATYLVSTPQTGLRITYDPKEKFSTQTGMSYSQPNSRTKNPVYNALKTKSAQLKKSSVEGMRAVILCNGDCDLLNPQYKTALQRSELQMIVEEFLDKSSSVDLVLTISSEHDWLAAHQFDRKRDERFISVRAFQRKRLKEQKNAINELAVRLMSSFPEPSNTPFNARSMLKRKHDPKAFETNPGYSLSMSKGKFDKYSLSANTLLAYLAGKITFEEFSKTAGFINDGERKGNGLGNPFEGAIQSKLRIESLRLIEDRTDDNSIEFVFADDPAVSDFVNPKRSKEEDPEFE